MSYDQIKTLPDVCNMVVWHFTPWRVYIGYLIFHLRDAGPVTLLWSWPSSLWAGQAIHHADPPSGMNKRFTEGGGATSPAGPLLPCATDQTTSSRHFFTYTAPHKLQRIYHIHSNTQRNVPGTIFLFTTESTNCRTLSKCEIFWDDKKKILTRPTGLSCC